MGLNKSSHEQDTMKTATGFSTTNHSTETQIGAYHNESGGDNRRCFVGRPNPSMTKLGEQFSQPFN